MTAAAAPPTKPPNAWGDNRLVAALKLLALLPTTPGATLADLTADLEVSRSKLFRLMRALRKADIDVESVFSPRGVKLYYLPKQRRMLIDRILGQ